MVQMTILRYVWLMWPDMLLLWLVYLQYLILYLRPTHLFFIYSILSYTGRMFFHKYMSWIAILLYCSNIVLRA